MIWAGGGVVLGDASPALTAVAEYLQAPVVTTRQGKGAIDDRHPLAAGSVWVNRRMQPAARRRRRRSSRSAPTSSATSCAAEKTVVHVDVDPAEIGRHFGEPDRGRR